MAKERMVFGPERASAAAGQLSQELYKNVSIKQVIF
jgi:hypothetical protein